MSRTLALATLKKIGKSVLLQGWVATKRDHGRITFIDLRDRSGLVQIVGGKDLAKVGPEDVVEITGTVKARPDQLVNPKLATGTVEVEAKTVTLLNPAKELPLPLDTPGHDIGEDIRLKYRYLDLRRSRLQRNIRVRSDYVQAAREYLFSQDFVEIETPMLTKSTPEGSRDFIVPSRLQPGKFFALPQSPQQYKQLLMVAGFERYFQIARCLRDEDPRADRGFEHTQIDLEMSFVTREDVMHTIEQMVIYALKKIGGKIVTRPFPVFTYQEALHKFGADKFDLRTKQQQANDELAFAWVIDFPFFEKTAAGGWTFTHNPFSLPKAEFIDDLLAQRNIGDILTTQYDLVCNGLEVAGGSIRSNTPQILTKVFEIIGHTSANIKSQFGHMLEAFEYGAPPHGGCAHGFERLLMAFFGEEYLREVQAFPQTGRGQTSVMDAPSSITAAQLRELGLQLVGADQSGSLFDRIQAKLNSLNISYKLLEHQPVTTSEEASKIRGTELAQGAKALVMYADKHPIMIVVSAATKVDLKAFKQFAKIKDLRMATPQEVEEITTVPIGAVAPFGSLCSLPTYVDSKLTQKTDIVFNAGRRDRSIIMAYADYLRAEQPRIGSFATST